MSNHFFESAIEQTKIQMMNERFAIEKTTINQLGIGESLSSKGVDLVFDDERDLQAEWQKIIDTAINVREGQDKSTLKLLECTPYLIVIEESRSHLVSRFSYKRKVVSYVPSSFKPQQADKPTEPKQETFDWWLEPIFVLLYPLGSIGMFLFSLIHDWAVKKSK